MKPSLLSALLAAVLTVLIWLFHVSGLVESFEYATLKWRYELREKLNSRRPDPAIVLVGIDDQSTNQLGAWPFPRKTHAGLLALLADEKPAVVAWDIMFTEPKKDLPEGDDLLVEATKLFPHFISGATRDDNQGRTNPSLEEIGPTKPLSRVSGDLSSLTPARAAALPFDQVKREDGTDGASLLKNSEFGFVDCDPSYGGVRLYLPMVILYQGKLFPSFVLKTVMDYVGADADAVTVDMGNEITVPRKEGAPLYIPINAKGEFLINYRYIPENFGSISYYGLLYFLSGKSDLEATKAQVPDFEEQMKKQLPPLGGKIVVFGFTGKGFDTGATPLQENGPLVTVHLNALSNILQQDFLYPVPTWAWMLGVFLVLWGFGYGLTRASLLLVIPSALSVLGFYFVLSYALFQYAHLWLPTALPMDAIALTSLVVIGYLYFGEGSQKRMIKTAMAAYIPEKVMQRVLEHPDNLKLGGTKREISVLFCDIRGFTKYCDNRDPEDVVGVLNEYMEVMSEVIFRYEGTIDKYIGDCIMAFWNAPEDQPDHAQRAVCCAMEMRYALANYKTRRAGIDTEIFECGIGIHTGPALVGNVGSSRRLSYTAIGSTVNLAARLEALTKRFTSRIIISEATYALLSGEFTYTDLGEVSVPGFAQKVRLYSVEAQQDIGSALLVGRKVAHDSNVSVAEVEKPIWAPAPLPEDAEVDAEGKG